MWRRNKERRAIDNFEQFQVVVNTEGQYSVWPIEMEVPGGWRATGASGTKEECLANVREAWTDMRPLSLRREMAG